MKIEVGEYVRTSKGEIFKVAEVVPTLGKEIAIVKKENGYPKRIDLQNEKHSKNIIDLIEVGDILIMLDTKFNTKDYIFIDDIEMLQAVRTDLKDRCKLISILTKEQYMQNCYKIPEKSSDIN